MASERFELVQLRNDVWGLRSRAFAEVCHPGVGPREEAEALYVRGLRLREGWSGHPGEFVLWDVGLGGAANALAMIEAAHAFPLALRVVSFDRTLAALAFALRHTSELGYFGALDRHARTLLSTGIAEFHLGSAEIRWQYVQGDFPALLETPEIDQWPTPQAVAYDPYSPSANPEMWTLPLFKRIVARLNPARPCVLATYSRATLVRVALLLAGFFVGKGAGIGEKEETTLASNSIEQLREPLDQRWLLRARASGAAEPWNRPPYVRQALRQETWDALLGHPQFARGVRGGALRT